MTDEKKIIPLYNSKGDAEVFLVFPYLFNHLGEWVGWVTSNKDVYSVRGSYVGTISKDKRILCKRYTEARKPNLIPPSPPHRVMPPAIIPLAPMMSELLFSTVDILLEEPEKLHTLDSGEFREDMN